MAEEAPKQQELTASSSEAVHLGIEVEPDTMFYRKDSNENARNRPTVADLLRNTESEKSHAEASADEEDGTGMGKINPEDKQFTEVGAGENKLGWFDGVFTPCLLNIFGVIMFLRLSFVAGQAGLLLGGQFPARGSAKCRGNISCCVLLGEERCALQ